MIISKIQGGLGNQLFQYAIGYALAHKYKKKFLIDISGLEKHVEGHLDRSLMLSQFNITGKIANITVLNNFRNGNFCNLFYTPPKKYFKQLVFDEQPPGKINYFKTDLIVKSPTYKFEPDILELSKGNIFLDGYWQSYKYFDFCNESLLKEFTFKNMFLNEINLDILSKIQISESISIHIRRTDYINTEFGKTHFISLPIEYYNAAIEYFKSLKSNLSLFVFSDDIEWAKTHLKTPYETYYISNTNPVEDMFLMSKCKHHIIANSSFSWWAAWLNKNLEKIVVSPQKWYKNVDVDLMNDLIPSNWIKI